MPNAKKATSQSEITTGTLSAYENFFANSEEWPENDPYATYQPPFEHIIARLLVESATNKVLAELTTNGVLFLSRVLPQMDTYFNNDFCNLKGAIISGAKQKKLDRNTAKVVKQVAEAIEFLMNMNAFEMEHYPEGHDRFEEHEHEWPLGNLVDPGCEDSLSYIGGEEYSNCEIAYAAAIGAINPEAKDLVDIMTNAPRVLKVYELNRKKLKTRVSFKS